jgi:hypothetical protein
MLQVWKKWASHVIFVQIFVYRQRSMSLNIVMIGEVSLRCATSQEFLPHIVSDAAEYFSRNVGSQFELEGQILNGQFHECQKAQSTYSSHWT